MKADEVQNTKEPIAARIDLLRQVLISLLFQSGLDIVRLLPLFSVILFAAAIAAWPLQTNAEQPVQVTGELKAWHKVTLQLEGPTANETDSEPNPFLDYRFDVLFEHESGSPSYRVPGYFAADGNAANSSANSGNVWRAHLSPDKPGQWTYTVLFRQGEKCAIEAASAGRAVAKLNGLTGSFKIAASDKEGRDLRGKGRLQYVGERYLVFAETNQPFLKAGPDAPETLLAYEDFDGTVANKKNVPLKTWKAHIQDWKTGDPTWKEGKGKGLIGALNYLASQGMNSFSFLPYNAGGDGDNVWPMVSKEDKLHYDCSKLDQWGIVFDHATQNGIYCHFKLQETENDDDRKGKAKSVPDALDNGDLGPERKLYLREMIGRYGHLLALNWNLGEENTQSAEQQIAMARYLAEVDPYQHLRVIHTYPNKQEDIYPKLLGDASALTGASLQNSWQVAHERTLRWIKASQQAGKPWVVCNDEQNPAGLGVPPDPGYQGHSGVAEEKGKKYDLHDIRKNTLWGTLLAGGGGVEYYFGYKLPENDLLCEDFRSREQSWKYCRIAIEFFAQHNIPIREMENADALVGNPQAKNSIYCLAKPGDLYLVYLTKGGTAELDLQGAQGQFTVEWFNPRSGGPLKSGSVSTIEAAGKQDLGMPPADSKQDWLAVVRRK